MRGHFPPQTSPAHLQHCGDKWWCAAPVQKRRWLGNLGLLAAPFLICMLLWVLQEVINKQLDSRSFRCGCKCLACCDWVPAEGGNSSSAGDVPFNGSTAVSYQCYEATDDKPCSPYAKCQARPGLEPAEPAEPADHEAHCTRGAGLAAGSCRRLASSCAKAACTPGGLFFHEPACRHITTRNAACCTARLTKLASAEWRSRRCGLRCWTCRR